MGIFDPDSPFMTAIGRLSDIIIINILFVVFSLPVITIFPALAAMYESMEELIEKDEFKLFTFFHSFKRNFSRSILLFIVCLISSLFLFVFYKTIQELDGTIKKFYSFSFCIFIIFLIFTERFLFLTLLSEKKILKTIKKSMIKVFLCFPEAVLSILILIVSLALAVSFFIRGNYLPIYIALTCGIGIISYLNTILYIKAMERLKRGYKR